MRKSGVYLLFILTIVASLSWQSCTKPEQEALTANLKSIGNILAAAWRSDGNAILILDSDVKRGVVSTISFHEEEYPVDERADESFWTKQKLQDRLGSNNIEQFTLMCGVKGENPLVTYIVFWSEDYWEGTKQVFQCGGARGYEISSKLDKACSFCVITALTPENRRLRCLYGPRCDDGQKNLNESDVDCGGRCEKCAVNRDCNTDIDCASNQCLNGKCKQPSCSDGIKNQNETDIDCGGSCKKCSNDRDCKTAADCQSGNCENRKCRPEPTCNGNPAGPSADIFLVLVKDRDQCGYVEKYFANSLDEAKACASRDGWVLS